MALILLFLSFSLFAQDELIVYNFDQQLLENVIEVVEPCPVKCPNETLSEGYGEADPHYSWEETEATQESVNYSNQIIINTLPFVADPIMRAILKEQIR